MEARVPSVSNPTKLPITTATTACHLQVFGIEADCFLGYYDHEQLALRRVVVDVELVIYINSDQVFSDELQNTLNYEKIAAEVKRVAGSQRFKLVETLCAQMLQALAQIKGVSNLKVAVTKHNPIENVRGVRIEMQSH
jgi:dihydroneopterin aldolase